MALLAVGCSGKYILLTTDKALPSNGGGNVSAGDDSKGGSNFGGSIGDDPVVEAPPGPGAEHGGWLAYVLYDAKGSSQIQIATVDGECERPLVLGQGHYVRQPKFSADGTRLAFAGDSTGQFQIYVMDLAGGEPTQITNEAYGATYPSWSPNGKSIAFVTADPEAGSPRPGNGRNAVMLVDTTTLQTRPLADDHPPYAGSAFASNNLLLVSREVNLIGIQLDTLVQYEVSPNIASSMSVSPTLTSPSVSPDRSRFVFTGKCATEENQLYIGRIGSTTETTCENTTPLPSISPLQYGLSWGPNGQIAVETSNHDLVFVSSDGSSGITRFKDDPQPLGNPAFAPLSVALDCTE